MFGADFRFVDSGIVIQHFVGGIVNVSFSAEFLYRSSYQSLQESIKIIIYCSCTTGHILCSPWGITA